MSKYSGFLYRTDTYGERVRGDIPISIQNTGYWTNESGYTFAKVRIKMGNSLSEYPDGSEVVLKRGSSWYPDLPGKGYEDQDSTQNDEQNDVVFEGQVLNGTVSGLRSTYTEYDIDPVPANSVLYLRIFVREPPVDDGEGTLVYLPWDVRGSAFAVMAGMYGGRQAALSSVPMTFYTDGDVHGTVNENGVTAKFVSSLGFMADTIFTDGALMVDGPSRLHPNMVWPLLASFGMPQNEISAFSDSHLFGRLKNLLFAYRRILSSRGIAGRDRDGLQELARVVTGYEIDVLPDPENLISTLGGVYPAGTSQDCLGRLVGTGVGVRGDVEWSAVSTQQVYQEPNHPPPWGDLWVEHEASNMWSDTWGEKSDVWIDAWNQFDLIEWFDVWSEQWESLSRCVEYSLEDPWYDQDYEQHVDWVHCMRGSGSIGTLRTTSDRLDTSVCELVEEGQFRFRMRALGEGTVQPFLLVHGHEWFDVWSDRWNEATVIETTIDPVDLDYVDEWQSIEVVASVSDPGGWMGWKVETTGTIFLGALEIRGVGIDVHDPETPSVWMQPYRNPRSIVVAVHTQWVEISVSPSSFDSEEVLVDDGSVRFNQGAGEASGSFIPNDVLSVRKLEEIMPDYLPHGVSARVIAAWSPEYQYRFPERNPYVVV